jgi:hypothetical protein
MRWMRVRGGRRGGLWMLRDFEGWVWILDERRFGRGGKAYGLVVCRIETCCSEVLFWPISSLHIYT